MVWDISKEFNFCYGHRVWSQSLIGAFTEKGNTACKCRHLHGHEGKVEVHLTSEYLENGMVTDFLHLGWLKTFIDNTIDHKFIIDKNDPMFLHFVGAAKSIEPNLLDGLLKVGYSLDTSNIVNPHEKEILDGFFIVDFVPTSEKLSEWMFNLVAFKMQRLAKVSRIDWWETPKSRSTYIG